MSWAVGLGAVKIYSSINEPLNAIVPIIKTQNLAPEDIQVALASQDVFEQVGIKRPYYLGVLRFRVHQSTRGKMYIHITTKDAVSHSFLNFIIDFRWPTGRLLRQYMILLSPVGYTKNQYRITKVPPQFRPGKKPTAADVGQEDISRPRLYGPTSSKDELWDIARKVRPNDRVTMEQVVVAIYQANPAAFEGNVNTLMKGYTLKVPSIQTMKQVSPEKALEIVLKQNKIWKRKQRRKKKRRGKEERHHRSLRVKSNLQEKAASAKQSETTKQIIPIDLGVSKLEKTNNTATSATQQTTANNQKIADLKAELAVTGESVDKVKQENQVVKIDLSKLKDQNKKLQAEIIEKDKQLYNLEKNFESKFDTNKKQNQSTKVVVSQPRSSTTNTSAQEIEKGLGIDVFPRLQHGFSKRNLMIFFLVLLVMIIVFILFVFVRKRRAKQANHPDNAREEELLADTKATLQAQQQTSDNKQTTVDDVSSENETNRTADSTAPSNDEPEQVSAGSSHVAVKPISAEVSQVDALEEAVVYIAYHRYEQAKNVLLEAIAEHSARNDLLVKMLEVLVLMGDVAEFEKYNQQLPDNLGDTEPALWQQVLALRNQIDELQAANPETGHTADTISTVDAAIDNSLSDTSTTEDTPEALKETSVSPADTRQEAAIDELAPMEPTEPMAEFDPDIIANITGPIIDESTPTVTTNSHDTTTELPSIESPQTESNRTMDFEGGLGDGLSVSKHVIDNGDDTQPVTDKQADTGLGDNEEIATEEGQILSQDDLYGMLDLAIAYIEIDDKIGAKELLETLIAKADPKLKEKAQELLDKLK